MSIVIPAYNEARRIARSLAAIGEWAEIQRREIELVISDDGSSDETIACAESAALGASIQRVLLRNAPNRGKGAALRAGVAVTTGELVLLCDADLSTPIDELGRLEAAIDAGADVAIASRDLPDSQLDPPQPLSRRLLAWAFRTYRRRLLLPAIRDTQCGFKLWSGDLARAVFAAARCDGWLIDCETLALAESGDAKIAEVGVVWRDDRDSRVRIWRDLPGALRELRQISRTHRRPSAGG
ncbi:MAG: glycosyltransferase [Phycisphaerae bacterium]